MRNKGVPTHPMAALDPGTVGTGRLVVESIFGAIFGPSKGCLVQHGSPDDSYMLVRMNVSKKYRD